MIKYKKKERKNFLTKAAYLIGVVDEFSDVGLDDLHHLHDVFVTGRHAVWQRHHLRTRCYRETRTRSGINRMVTR